MIAITAYYNFFLELWRHLRAGMREKENGMWRRCTPGMFPTWFTEHMHRGRKSSFSTHIDNHKQKAQKLVENSEQDVFWTEPKIVARTEVKIHFYTKANRKVFNENQTKNRKKMSAVWREISISPSIAVDKSARELTSLNYNSQPADNAARRCSITQFYCYDRIR